jgi:hypothetical protein
MQAKTKSKAQKAESIADFLEQVIEPESSESLDGSLGGAMPIKLSEENQEILDNPTIQNFDEAVSQVSQVNYNWNNIRAISRTEENINPVLIENWLTDEGYNICAHKRKQTNEVYKFRFESNTEKGRHEYLMEVCNFGREIKKIKKRVI